MLPLNNNSLVNALGSLWRSNIAEPRHNWEYYVLNNTTVICRTTSCSNWNTLHASHYKLTLSGNTPLKLLVYYNYPDKAHIVLKPLARHESYFYDKKTGLLDKLHEETE